MPNVLKIKLRLASMFLLSSILLQACSSSGPSTPGNPTPPPATATTLPFTATETSSNTYTPATTQTPTPTFTPTPSVTFSGTVLNTATPTRTETSTFTAFPTLTVSNSPTASDTLTPSSTPTSFGTIFPTLTPTRTGTATSTSSPTDTPTPTSSPTLLPSFTATETPTGSFTTTATPTLIPVGTATVTYGTPAVCGSNGICASLDMEWLQQSGSSLVLNFLLQVNGAPETTAGVTLVTPGGPVPLSFSALSSGGALYTTASSWTYVPGGLYTIQFNTSIGQGSASVTAPGGITHAADGSRSDWTDSGTFNYVIVWDAGGYDFTDGLIAGNAVPPVNIPLSIYASPGTTYNVNTDISTKVGYANGSIVVNLLARNVMWTTVTVPTATATPSSPTPTDTGTPTATPTATPIHAFVTQFNLNNNPSYAGIAVNAAGTTVYAVDGNNQVVDAFASDGTLLTSWNPVTVIGINLYQSPQGIAVDPTGNVYVAEGGVIMKYDYTGGFLKVMGSQGTGNGQFAGSCQGLAVNSAGTTLYATDTGNQRVEALNLNGGYLAQWGSSGSGNGQFNGPWGIGLNSAGTTVYVSDYFNNRVQAFDPTGTYLTQFGGGSLGGPPTGLTVDPSENIYVSNGNYFVDEFTPSLSHFGRMGGCCAGNYSFYSATCLAADSSGYLYVCDNIGPGRIVKYAP